MDNIQGCVILSWSPSISPSSLCCLSLWWHVALANSIFHFLKRGMSLCWHVAQTWGSFLMLFHSSRQVPCGSIWLIVLFQWLGLSPINSGIPFLPSYISHIFSFDLCRPAPRLGVFVFRHPCLALSILIFSSFRLFFNFQNVWNCSVFV